MKTIPDQWISGNLWNLPLRPEQLDEAGPLASFMRHVTTTASPNVPHYVSTGIFPVRDLADLSTEPTLQNVIAHQKYLEMLSFEAHALHQWSRMIPEQITAEREQTHLQLATMLEKMAASQQVNAWTRAQASQSMAPRPMATPPAQPQMGSINMPVQPPSGILQVKPAPSRPPAQTRSSTPPTNQPFPPQQSADPWAQGWYNMHK